MPAGWDFDTTLLAAGSIRGRKLKPRLARGFLLILN